MEQSMKKLHELRRERAGLMTKVKELAEKDGELSAEETKEFEGLEVQIKGLDTRIARLVKAAELEADEAKEIPEDDEKKSEEEDEEKEDDEDETEEKNGRVRVVKRHRVFAEPKKKFEKGIIVGGALKMMAAGGGSIFNARQVSKEVYGESHPVTKALNASSGPTGGFVVPPEYVAEIISILRARTVVRQAGPRGLPMPRGTLTLPRQTQAATANYGNELSAIPVSEQRLGQIVATFKKLTAMVPISNDLLRYSDPAIDAFVRDDLVAVMARREDLAFIRGDGASDSPRGFRSFLMSSNIISSTSAFTLATAAAELGGLVNKLETANVDMVRPVWIMAPRVKNYLFNVQNAQGFYVYRDEMKDGTLLGYPFFTTTQIPTNLVNGSDTDCSELYIVDMDQAIVLDSMTMQIDVSREATYVDANGVTISTFQSDQTLMRCISEHDFQMRQDAAIAMLQHCRWAPAIA